MAMVKKLFSGDSFYRWLREQGVGKSSAQKYAGYKPLGTKTSKSVIPWREDYTAFLLQAQPQNRAQILEDATQSGVDVGKAYGRQITAGETGVTEQAIEPQARREIWAQTPGERIEAVREARRAESVGLRSAQLKLQQAEKALAEFEGREYAPSELAQIKERPIAMMGPEPKPAFTPLPRSRGGIRGRGSKRRGRPRPSGPSPTPLTSPSAMPIQGQLYRKPLTRQTILKPGPKEETPLYTQPISGRR